MVRLHTGAVLRTALVVTVVGLLLVTLLWIFQRRLIYLPSTGPVPSAAQMIPGARDVAVETSDGLRLGAWYVPARQPERGMGVLIANGNAGDRSLRAPLAKALADRGLAVLLLDYRGFGGNPGSPTERGLARDVRAGQRFLTEEVGIPANRLIYFGESLGAAVVAELAVEHPPAALVLRSPFVDLPSVGRIHYPFLPVRTLLKDRFPVAELVKQVRVPVTVVYGSADSIVPPAQSRAVAEAAPTLRDLVEVPGADHNDRVLLDGAVLIDVITRQAELARDD